MTTISPPSIASNSATTAQSEARASRTAVKAPPGGSPGGTGRQKITMIW
jgi:hypothetical protein